MIRLLDFVADLNRRAGRVLARVDAARKRFGLQLYRLRREATRKVWFS